ncbi:MAG: sporulation protein YunB [Clostridia bacterium]|nr:sporulation protein YunB [Clostridia bacterium]
MYYRKHERTGGIRRGGFARGLHRGRARRWIALLMAVAMVLFIIIDLRVRPVMNSMIQQQVRMIFTAAVNGAVADVLREQELSYDEFVTLSTSSDGSVTSVQTDSAAVNSFRAQVSSAVAERMQRYNACPAEISLGSLTGINMLVGRGPKLKLRLELGSSVTADISGSFTEAGINQTLHSINCVVSGEVFAAIPGLSSPVAISTEVMIAQSVIVGETPESFTYVYGDKSDDIGRVFDYGDPYGEDIQRGGD